MVSLCGREEKLEFIARKRQSFRHQIINGSSATVCVRQETALCPSSMILVYFFSSTSFSRIMRRTGIKEKKRKSRRITFPPTLKYLELLISLRINCNYQTYFFLFVQRYITNIYFEIICELWVIVTIDFRFSTFKNCFPRNYKSPFLFF